MDVRIICDNLWKMAAVRSKAVIADATDNGTLRLGTSSAELVMEVSHPLSNTLVSRVVNVPLFTFTPCNRKQKLLYSKTASRLKMPGGESQCVEGHFNPKHGC